MTLAHPYSILTKLTCRLCNAEAHPIFRAAILNHHDVGYFRCPVCDLIQTETPYWLDEAYTSAICATDTGAIARNQLTCDLTSVVAWLLGITPQSKCLDHGGGHGVFVRMMRDRGFDFRWSDRYAENLFARGFEGSLFDEHDLVTAFEVLEHLSDVAGELENIFANRPRYVLVSTMLHRGDGPAWWYYSPHTGQHVAFYSSRTMEHIAGRFGYGVTGSRAYTLFIRDDVNVTSLRMRLARRIVRTSKGNMTGKLAAVLAAIGPNFPALTIGDSERASRLGVHEG